MDILGVVTRVPLLVFGVEKHDDDFADRINYRYTAAILVIFAIIVTNRQFGQKQIHCWVPAYFTRNYEEYINDICWVSNTYYVSLDKKLPEDEEMRKNNELKYYQWVPFILLLEAFFFYIPHITWRAGSRRSGIDIRDIVEAASNYKSVDKYERREKYMEYMISSIDQYVDDPRRCKEFRARTHRLKRIVTYICLFYGKFLGNYLVVLYLFIKILFIVNCIGQLFLLNTLLGHPFHKFGVDVIEKIINGKGWDTIGSRIFPKISMCDFRIREIGNPKISHRYTVQCVLPINLFNQQIFTFIWFWYCIVLVINVYSLCVWLYRLLPQSRIRHITRRIKIMRDTTLVPDKVDDVGLQNFHYDLIHQFVLNYLEPDGAFMLRVLSSNTSDFVGTELIQNLWKRYRTERKFDRNRRLEDEIESDMSSSEKHDNSENTTKDMIDGEYYERKLSDYEVDGKKLRSDDMMRDMRLGQPPSILKRSPFIHHKRAEGKLLFKRQLARLYRPKKAPSRPPPKIPEIVITEPVSLNRALSYESSVEQFERRKSLESLPNTTSRQRLSSLKLDDTTHRGSKFKETET